MAALARRQERIGLAEQDEGLVGGLDGRAEQLIANSGEVAHPWREFA